MQKRPLPFTPPSGGKGTCGKCKVEVHGDVSALSSEEKQLLTPEEISRGMRLACRTYITGSATVWLAQENRINNSKEKIETHCQYEVNSNVTRRTIVVPASDLENNVSLTEAIRQKVFDIDIDLGMTQTLSNRSMTDGPVTLTLYGNKLIDIECNAGVDKKYGAAIDLGTTTIACYLMDLTTGTQLYVASEQNPQSVYGADVISRINFCLKNDNGLSLLGERVKRSISGLLKKACAAARIQESHLYECVLVGNTTMHHIFWGLNPSGLSKVPFAPVTRDMITTDAATADISGMNARGRVVFLPCIGGFVGSDTLGAVIAAGLNGDGSNRQNNTLIIDLGTNGEIVLSTAEQTYACSAAAGPAFEGASIEHGMQATAGAINRAYIDDELHYETIDGKSAKGLCGSGLIDIVSHFLSAGIINEKGRIADPETVENKALSQRIIKQNRRKRFVLAWPHESDTKEEVYISQKDIRELQLAKGAIRAGINILLKEADIPFEEIGHIFLAGAFGNFINKENARRIGVFPDIPMDRVSSLGNAAGDGAKLVLCQGQTFGKNLLADAMAIKHVAVSDHPDFQDEFVRCMSFND